MRPYTPPGKGTSVRHRVAEAGAIFPARARTGRRAVLPSPPCPLSRKAGEGERAAPLSHAVGEGLGVRAKKRARLAHSELKRCTLIIPIAEPEFTKNRS